MCADALGYAADRWLFFVAGGLAIADFNFHEGAITTTTVTVHRGGYLRRMVDRRRHRIRHHPKPAGSGRISCMINFGHKNYVGCDGDPYRVSLTGSTVRGALAWKF